MILTLTDFGGDDDLFYDGSSRQLETKTSERGNGDWNKDASVWV